MTIFVELYCWFLLLFHIYIFEFGVEIIRTRDIIFGVVLTNVILGTDCETVT